METHQTGSEVISRIEKVAARGALISTQIERFSPETFLVGAAASVGAALLLRALGRQHDAQFVGQWAPTLLLVGLYARRRELFERERIYSAGEGAERGVH